ncbi:MAG: PadR family transcriptional regulator [Candidatus Thorarchaeota archaeon]
MRSGHNKASSKEKSLSSEARSKIQFLSDYQSDLRRVILKLMILCLIRLETEHAHAYGLIRLLRETGVDLQAGTVYALLKRMEKDGLIVSILGEYKIYTITDYGEHMIDEMVSAYTEFHKLGNETIMKWYTEIKAQREKRI